MKRFSATEIGGLILAVLLFLGGLDLVIWPNSGAVPHFTNDALGLSPKNSLQVIGPTGERLFGVLAMVFGIVVGALAIYREKK
jgi:hypothetical protein